VPVTIGDEWFWESNMIYNITYYTAFHIQEW